MESTQHCLTPVVLEPGSLPFFLVLSEHLKPFLAQTVCVSLGVHPSPLFFLKVLRHHDSTCKIGHFCKKKKLEMERRGSLLVFSSFLMLLGWICLGINPLVVI